MSRTFQVREQEKEKEEEIPSQGFHAREDTAHFQSSGENQFQLPDGAGLYVLNCETIFLLVSVC